MKLLFFPQTTMHKFKKNPQVRSGHLIQRCLKTRYWVPIFLAIAPNIGWADITQTWTNLVFKLYTYERVSVDGAVQLRFDLDRPRFSGALAGIQARYRLNKNLSINSAVRSLHLRGGPENDINQFLRFEFEINPHGELGKHWGWHLRNRVESIEREGLSRRTRFRHRALFARSLNHPVFRGISSSVELFHEDEPDLFNVNEIRLIPIGVRFKTQSLRGEVSILIRDLDRSVDDQIYILQTMFRFR